MAETLHVELRPSCGTRNARRLRRAGQVPAVLYGHKQETINLAVSAEELEGVLRHGARLVRLTGAVQEQAFIRELQWDTWGSHVLHVDFTRVSEHERVRVEVSVELRGEAPGQKAGGVIKHVLHQMEIECEATSIPDKLYVNINQLQLGQQITVGQLELPPTVKVLADPEELVVECHEAIEVAEEEAAPAAEGEPEVIGRKKEAEEGEGEE